MRLFSKYFHCGRPVTMAQVLYSSKSKADNNKEVNLIDVSFRYFADKVKKIPPSTNEKEEIKILLIRILFLMSKIKKGNGLNFNTRKNA